MSSSAFPPEDAEPAPASGGPMAGATSRSQPIARCLDALSDLLSADFADPGNFGRIRRTIRALAAAAREHEVSPEQMLVELKTTLTNAPALRNLPSSSAEAARAKLVSIAIRAYYGGDDS